MQTLEHLIIHQCDKNSDLWSVSHLLTWRRLSLWTILQPTTRGKYGFTLGKHHVVWCLPKLKPVLFPGNMDHTRRGICPNSIKYITDILFLPIAILTVSIEQVNYSLVSVPGALSCIHFISVHPFQRHPPEEAEEIWSRSREETTGGGERWLTDKSRGGAGWHRGLGASILSAPSFPGFLCTSDSTRLSVPLR